MFDHGGGRSDPPVAQGRRAPATSHQDVTQYNVNMAPAKRWRCDRETKAIIFQNI
jgi:hypothetical protein